MNRHAYAYIPTFRHTCTHAHTCLYVNSLCVWMIMVRILTNCGTLHTTHTHTHLATSDKMKQHKVFHESFSLILQLGLPKVCGKVLPAMY